MNWSKIAALMIALLLLVNIFLGFQLYRQSVTMYRIDKEEISDIVSLFEKKGISLDEEIIPRRRMDGEILFGAYQADSFYDAAADYFFAAGEKAVRTVHMTATGIRMDCPDTAEYLTFRSGDYFSVTYSVYAKEDETLLSLMKALDTFDGDDALRSDVQRKLNDVGKFKDKKLSVSVSEAGSSDGYVLCRWQQLYDKTPLNGMTGTAAFDEKGRLCYFCGNVILPSSDLQIQSAEVCDQINLLLREYAQLSPGKIGVMRELSYSFGVSWNTRFDTFYLVPAWRVGYEDGSVRVWNALTESLYTNQ